jgi:hypothetical protein
MKVSIVRKEIENPGTKATFIIYVLLFRDENLPEKPGGWLGIRQITMGRGAPTAYVDSAIDRLIETRSYARCPPTL